MVRSLWKRTLITSLAWAGIALAQQTDSSAPAAPAARPQRTLTVQEPGKGPIKCKLIHSWKTPEGTKAYQVQAVDGGEMLTIVENGGARPVIGATGVQAVTTKIYHWGNSAAPPAGAPLPPSTPVPAAAVAAKETTKTAVPAAALATKEARKTPAPAVPVTSREMPKTPAPAAAVTTKETPRTPVLPTLPLTAAPKPYASQTTATAMPVVTQAPAPQPPVPPSGPGMRAVSPPSKVVSTKVLDSTQDMAPKAVSQSAPVVTSVSKPAPVVPSMPAMVSTPRESAPIITKAPEMPRQVMSVAEAREKAGAAEVVSTTTNKGNWWSPSRKEQDRVDPLKMPQAYSKVDTGSVIITPAEVKVQPHAGPVAGGYSPGQPIGVQSVIAAGAYDPQTPVHLPVPTMTLPQRHPVQQAQQQMAYRQPNEAEVNAFTPPGMPIPATPAAPVQQPGLANAFTPPTPPGPMPTLPVSQASYMGAPAQKPVVTTSPFTQADTSKKMVETLRDGLMPSQREWAVEGLAKVDWRACPEAVSALVQAAKDDPAVNVRTCCIRCLGKMKAKTPDVINALEALKGDRDSHVREEAEHALACIGH